MAASIGKRENVMAPYMLQQTVLRGESTVAGADYYQAGNLLDQNNRPVGVFTMVTNTFSNVTNRPVSLNLDTGMLTLQLFFEAQGQGGSGRIQETMVLKGAPIFVGPLPLTPDPGPGHFVPPRQVRRANGSVSAATPLFASFITHHWSLTPISNSPTNTQFQLVIV